MAMILVVDDDRDIQEACRLVLEKAGHTVLTAASPSEGHKVLEAQRPALLILDVMMESPDDGIVMAQALRRAGNTLPILMLTSLPKVVGAKYGRDDEMVPVDEFVEKPLAPARLLELVNGLLERKG